LTKVEPK